MKLLREEKRRSGKSYAEIIRCALDSYFKTFGESR